MLPVVCGPESALAKFTIVPVWADRETIPFPETDITVPDGTFTTSPLFVVTVTVPPPVLLTLRPHSSGRVWGVHGMSKNSTLAAIVAVDGSANKPAKTNALAQLCLYITRHSLCLKSLSHPTEPTNDPRKLNYPRTPSVP